MEHIRPEALKSQNTYTHRKVNTVLSVPVCYLWVRMNQKECIFLRICGRCPSKVKQPRTCAVVGSVVDEVDCAFPFLLFIPLCCQGPHTEGDKMITSFICEASGLNSTSLSSGPVGFLQEGHFAMLYILSNENYSCTTCVLFSDSAVVVFVGGQGLTPKYIQVVCMITDHSYDQRLVCELPKLRGVSWRVSKSSAKQGWTSQLHQS